MSDAATCVPEKHAKEVKKAHQKWPFSQPKCCGEVSFHSTVASSLLCSLTNLAKYSRPSLQATYRRLNMTCTENFSSELSSAHCPWASDTSLGVPIYLFHACLNSSQEEHFGLILRNAPHASVSTRAHFRTRKCFYINCHTGIFPCATHL